MAAFRGDEGPSFGLEQPNYLSDFHSTTLPHEDRDEIKRQGGRREHAAAGVVSIAGRRDEHSESEQSVNKVARISEVSGLPSELNQRRTNKINNPQ
jgi:hypothetical protein